MPIDIFETDDGKAVEFETDGGAPAAVAAATRWSAKTADHAIVVDEIGTRFTNTGDGPVSFTLPAPETGLNYGFCVGAEQMLTVVCADHEAQVIHVGGAVTTTDGRGSVQSDVAGSYIEMEAVDALQWIATRVVGRWAVNTEQITKIAGAGRMAADITVVGFRSRQSGTAQLAATAAIRMMARQRMAGVGGSIVGGINVLMAVKGLLSGTGSLDIDTAALLQKVGSAMAGSGELSVRLAALIPVKSSPVGVGAMVANAQIAGKLIPLSTIAALSASAPSVGVGVTCSVPSASLALAGPAPTTFLGVDLTAISLVVAPPSMDDVPEFTAT